MEEGVWLKTTFFPSDILVSVGYGADEPTQDIYL